MAFTTPSPVRRKVVASIAAALAAGLALTGCATAAPDTSEPAVPQAAESPFGHIHGFGINSTSGEAFVASHNGVFKLPSLDSDPIAAAELGEPVAGRAQDTMGFTMNGRQMFGSGHPDPAEQSAPPNLGFITSTDNAETWQTVSLGGEKDFHEIEVVRDAAGTITVYGVDSSTSQIMISGNGGTSWRPGAEVLVRDVSVDPVSGVVYATTENGLALSSDGGETFEVDPDAPALYLVDWVDGPSSEGLVGVDLEGNVWTRLGAEEWIMSGSVEGDVSAMMYSATPEPALLVADARGVVASGDLGATWRVVVKP